MAYRRRRRKVSYGYKKSYGFRRKRSRGKRNYVTMSRGGIRL